MEVLRSLLIKLLEGGQACDTFDSVVAEFDIANAFAIPAGAEHSAWQIVEHMRIALKDILQFSSNEDGHYKAMKWPDDYWPTNPEASEALWRDSLSAYRKVRAEFERLLQDANNDLFASFAWGEGQTLCREALVAAQHEAYHLGELVMLRRMI